MSVPRNVPSVWIMAQRRARGGKSKDKGEGPIASRVHQPSRRERLGPGSSRIETSILLPASHPIFPPSPQSSTRGENKTLSRPPIYSTGLHTAPQFRYRRSRITSADPTIHASFIPIRLAAVCDSIFVASVGHFMRQNPNPPRSLRIRHRDRTARTGNEARPRPRSS